MSKNPVFAEHANEETFATRDTRDETVDGFIEAVKQRSSDIPFWLCLDTYHFGIVELAEHPADVLLVFLYIKCTRTIY